MNSKLLNVDPPVPYGVVLDIDDEAIVSSILDDVLVAEEGPPDRHRP
jgi:hypothetical protein